MCIWTSLIWGQHLFTYLSWGYSKHWCRRWCDLMFGMWSFRSFSPFSCSIVSDMRWGHGIEGVYCRVFCFFISSFCTAHTLMHSTHTHTQSPLAHTHIHMHAQALFNQCCAVIHFAQLFDMMPCWWDSSDTWGLEHLCCLVSFVITCRKYHSR